MAKNIHIVQTSKGWGPKVEGLTRASYSFPNQSAAINKGREMAKGNSSELLIHGTNGKIRAKHSYGNDPFPPKG